MLVRFDHVARGIGDGKRFVVHADEKLTAFLELESVIRAAERREHCGAREMIRQLSRIE